MDEDLNTNKIEFENNKDTKDIVEIKNSLKEKPNKNSNRSKKTLHKQKKLNPKDKPKRNVWMIVIPLVIPLLIVAYILYMNFMPLDDVYTIVVGTPNDIDSSQEFYLNATPDLGVAQSYDFKTFRELNGITYAVFKPKAILHNELVTVSVEGENVFIMSPVINFSPENYTWDMKADFTKNISKQWKNEIKILPKNNSVDLTRNTVKYVEGCGAYFDGTNKLYLLNTSNEFENGSFTVYVEWKPEKNNESFQQIIGKFNWELLQHPNSVQFMVGRMNDKNGTFYSVNYPVTKEFFNQSHSALATYNPSENGYIELFVDGMSAGKVNIDNNIIWVGYNSNIDLSMGKSNHGTATYYKGCIKNAIIINKILNVYFQSYEFYTKSQETIIPIWGYGKLEEINITLKK